MTVFDLRAMLATLDDDVEIFVPTSEYIAGQMQTTTEISVIPIEGRNQAVLVPMEGAWKGKKLIVPEKPQ